MAIAAFGGMATGAPPIQNPGYATAMYCNSVHVQCQSTHIVSMFSVPGFNPAVQLLHIISNKLHTKLLICNST